MGKCGHATYVAPSGPPGPPFLPAAGDLYWLDSLLYSASDSAPRRPAVVLEVPSLPHSPIRVVTRTTRLNVAGVSHPAQPAWHLREGKFADLALVKQSDWHSPRVEFVATLDPTTMNAVKGRFE